MSRSWQKIFGSRPSRKKISMLIIISINSVLFILVRKYNSKNNTRSKYILKSRLYLLYTFLIKS